MEAAFGVGTTFSTSFGQTYFISLFVPALVAALPISEAEFGTLYGIGTLAGAMMLPFIAAHYDSTPLATYTRRVFYLLGISSLFFALTVHPMMLVAAVAGLRLSGPGLMTHVSNTTMAKGFEKRRGRALGLASLGYPLGEALLPPLAAMALLFIDWRVLWVPVAMLYLTALPWGVTWLVKRARFETFVAADYARIKAQRKGKLRSAWKLMSSDRRFWWIIPVQMLLPMLMTAVFLYQAPLAVSKGWSTTFMASLFSVFAVCKAGTSIWIGPRIDQHGALSLVGFIALPVSVGMAALALGSHPATAVIFFVLAGITGGSAGNVFSAVWAEMYGPRQLGAIKGLTGSLAVVCSAIGPVLAGSLLAAGVSFEQMLIGFALAFVFGSLGAKRIGITAAPGPTDHSPRD
ncbi:MAG: hypothetical protein SynsKO_37260 [Synoicihabitans sp.]